MKIFAEIEPVYYICNVKETNFVRLVKNCSVFRSVEQPKTIRNIQT